VQAASPGTEKKWSLLKEKKEGVRVRRGPDWSWGEQDHHEGKQQMGTTFSDGSAGRIKVKWDGSGRNNSYRVGASQKFDLEYEYADESGAGSDDEHGVGTNNSTDNPHATKAELSMAECPELLPSERTARVANLTGAPIDATAGAALALLALFGDAAQGNRLPRGTMGALGAPLEVSSAVLVLPDPMLASGRALLKRHELCRAWAAVSQLADVEPYGAYVAPTPAAGIEAGRQAQATPEAGPGLYPGVLHYLGTRGGTRAYQNPLKAGDVTARRSSVGEGKPLALVQHNGNGNFLTAANKYEVDVLEDLLEWMAND
jgi:hypothetical protein